MLIQYVVGFLSTCGTFMFDLILYRSILTEASNVSYIVPNCPPDVCRKDVLSLAYGRSLIESVTDRKFSGIF